ncbi:MAG: hypothetical protein SYC29_01445 [Planctomycetota bacterium]|nr:hypothetical protein [Planctomycetota bacterium]
MQRELRKTDDEHIARRAVLARFGSVKRIACRLWFDAMKETIMNQRIAMISNAVLAAACIAVCVIAFLALRQNNRIAETLVAKIETMGGRQEAAAASSVWADAKIRVLRGSPDGEPAERLSVTLEGEMFNPGTRDEVVERTDDNGVASFGLVRPGRYRLWIREPDVLWNHRDLLLFPGAHEPEPIVWPNTPITPASVSFAVEMPQYLWEQIGYVHCRFEALVDDLQEFEGTWQRSPTDLLLTPEGGVWIFTAEEFERVWENLPDDQVRLNQSALHLRDQLMMNAALQYRLERVSVLLPVADAEEPGVFAQFDWSDAQKLQSTPRQLRTRPIREPEPIIDKIYHVESDQENVWRIEMPEWLIEALELWFAAENETSESES